MLTIRERLNDTRIFRVYLNMIRNETIDVVRDLRKTIKDNAEGHPKQLLLEEEFVKRLGV